jgi:DHA1 family multidrug resistance protein-like MFS transporter
VYFIAFAVSAIIGLLIPVTPIFALKLGASQFELGLIGSVGAVIYVVVSFTLSSLWDAIGGRAPIIISCLLYSLTALLTSIADNPVQIILLKVVEGFSLSILWPPLESYVAEAKKSEVNNVVMNYCISWSSGNVLGTLISGFALELIELRSIFRIAGLCSCLLVAVSFMRIVNVRNRTEDSNSSISGNIRSLKTIFLKYSSFWISMIIYALSQGILLALFPAYAEIMGVPSLIIGLSIFLLTAGRTIGFVLFNKIPLDRGSMLKMGMFLMGFGSMIFIFFLDVILVFSASFVVGFGASIVYSLTFENISVWSEGQHCLYAGLFEGCTGLGYLMPIIGGALAEHNLILPYVFSSSVSLCFLFILVAKKWR